jgi:hypothetical protein
MNMRENAELEIVLFVRTGEQHLIDRTSRNNELMHS